MNENFNKFTDEQLTAYLDGEFEHTPALEIERALKKSVKLQNRLAELNFSENDLSNAMGGLLSAAPAMPELPVSVTPTASNDNSTVGRRGFIAACAAMVAVTSGVVGYSIAPTKEPGWRDYVAAYHALYISSTLSSVDNPEPVAIAELNRVGEAIGKQIDFSALKQVAGMDYKRAQILGFEGKPLAQMTFLSKMGTPIALCVIRNGKPDSGSMKAENLENMASVTWSKGGYEYLLIGGSDDQLMRSAGEYFRKTV